MPEVSVEKRFRGTVRLVTLHLWRVGRSTDVEKGLAEGLALGMINREQAGFIRRCFEIDARLELGAEPCEPVTMALVDELQACAIRLNSADPA